MDLPKTKKKSNNFVDLTGLTGRAFDNVQAMVQFLSRPDLIKKSYREGREPKTIDELRLSNGLRPDARFELMNIFLNPDRNRDMRYSYPKDESPYGRALDEAIVNDSIVNDRFIPKRSRAPDEISRRLRKRINE